MNSMKRSKRAPCGASPTQVRAVIRSPSNGGTQIIDLVPHHDPEISVLVRRVRYRIPMRDRDLLDPLHPYGIVDVPELVDVLARRRQRHLEDRAAHFTCVRMNP